MIIIIIIVIIIVIIVIIIIIIIIIIITNLTPPVFPRPGERLCTAPRCAQRPDFAHKRASDSYVDCLRSRPPAVQYGGWGLVPARSIRGLDLGGKICCGTPEVGLVGAVLSTFCPREFPFLKKEASRRRSALWS